MKQWAIYFYKVFSLYFKKLLSCGLHQFLIIKIQGTYHYIKRNCSLMNTTIFTLFVCIISSVFYCFFHCDLHGDDAFHASMIHFFFPHVWIKIHGCSDDYLVCVEIPDLHTVELLVFSKAYLSTQISIALTLFSHRIHHLH